MRPDEEAYYFHVLNDFAELCKSVGGEQVVYDLNKLYPDLPVKFHVRCELDGIMEKIREMRKKRAEEKEVIDERL